MSQSFAVTTQDWELSDFSKGATKVNLKSYLSDFQSKSGIPGLIVSISNDKHLSNQIFAVGHSMDNGDQGRPLLPDDLVPIGSASKSFTGLLLMRRVESGSLRLDSTLEQLLPAMLMDAAFRKVTLSQMLTHRAGFPNETPLKLIPFSGRNRVELFKTMLLQGPQNPVGKQVYSTYGLVAIGALLEILEGKSWERLIYDEVFRPLNLKSCKLYNYLDQAPDLSSEVPYFGLSDLAKMLWGSDGTQHHFRPLNPDGGKYYYDPLMNPGAGIFCTLSDLNTFMQAQSAGYLGTLNSPLLQKRESFAALYAVPEGSKWHYSHGAWSINYKNSKILSAWVYGAGGGTFTETAWFPERSLVITAFSNAWTIQGDAPWLDQLVENLSGMEL